MNINSTILKELSIITNTSGSNENICSYSCLTGKKKFVYKNIPYDTINNNYCKNIDNNNNINYIENKRIKNNNCINFKKFDCKYNYNSFYCVKKKNYCSKENKNLKCIDSNKYNCSFEYNSFYCSRNNVLNNNL